MSCKQCHVHTASLPAPGNSGLARGAHGLPPGLHDGCGPSKSWPREQQDTSGTPTDNIKQAANGRQLGGHANKPRRIRRIYARNAGACQFPVDAASALPPHADACHHLPAGLHADAASAQNQHGGAQNPTQGHTQSHAPQGQRQAAQEFSGLRHAVSPVRCGHLPARHG